MSPMLQVRGVTKAFDGFVAIDDVSLDIAPGTRHAVIGPNGAGKSTLFNLLSGAYVPDRGSVHFLGRSIAGLEPHAVVRMGMARSFQRVNIFARKTVTDNVAVACIARDNRHFRLFEPAQGLYQEESLALLERVGLAGEAGLRAGELAYGKQKQLELAVSLAARPKLLMLDEPTAGMSMAETRSLSALIGRLAQELGFTLLFTEHDMSVVFGIAERISVLHHGEIIAEGTPDEVRNDAEVRRVYLGQEVDAPHTAAPSVEQRP